jgi:hypothetical protein
MCVYVDLRKTGFLGTISNHFACLIFFVDMTKLTDVTDLTKHY